MAQAQDELLNQIVSYGVQKKKSKQDIMTAVLKSGKFNVTTAATSLKSLDDMGVFNYGQQEIDPLEIDRSKLTSVQNSAYNYGTRTLESGKNITDLEGTISQKGFMDSIGQSIQEKLAGTTTGQRFVSPEFQKFDQSKRDFVNAVLRRESGAVISPEEFDNATKQYFPVPGDAPATVEQKRKNRELTTKNLLEEAGVKTGTLQFQKKTETSALALNNENNAPLNQPQEIQQPEQKKEGFLSKTADFLGIKKFGQGIGITLFLKTQEGKDLQDKAAQGDKIAIETLQGILDEAPNAKELIGSAAMTALNIGTAGMARRATLLGKVAQGAATGYGFDVASNLQNKDKTVGEAFKPGAGTAVGAGLPIAGAGLKVGAKAIKNISSYLSGVPKEAIEEAFQRPEGVKQAIKTFVKNDDEKMRIVQNAQKGLSQIAKKRNEAYSTALKEIEKTTDTTQLSTDGLKKKVIDTLGEFKLLGENGKLDFTRSKFPSAQNSQLKELLQRISKWKDSSPTGLNDLGQIIDGYYKGGADTKAFDKIIVGLKNNLGSYVDNAVPAIGKMKQDYAKESALIKQIESELSLGKNKSVSTALNKLTSIFNNNSDFKEKLVKQLGEEGGQNLIDDIVGSMFTQWFPRGLTGRIITGAGGLLAGGVGYAGASGVSLPALAAGSALASPRLVGAATVSLGKLSKAIKKLPTDKLGNISKTALLDLITKSQRQ